MNESAASNGWKSDSLNHSKALERVISKSKINKSELPSLDSLIDDEESLYCCSGDTVLRILVVQ